jgi:hypothetical protein
LLLKKCLVISFWNWMLTDKIQFWWEFIPFNLKISTSVFRIFAHSLFMTI